MANRALPVIIQIVVFYLFMSWIVRMIRRRARPPAEGKPIRRMPRPSPGRSPSRRTEPVSQYSTTEHKDMMFNGVRWHVTLRPHRVPVPGTKGTRRDAYVDEPPRCPKCGLGVIEEKSWLGYTWSCPECGLKKHSGRSVHDVAESLARMFH
jgi:hypothetical protein